MALLTWLACSPSSQENSPNVILFLADDQGWTGTSVAMDDRFPEARSDFHRTPALERLAREGMRFAEAYAASPVCSPTRASLQTGMSPARLRMTDVIMGEIGRSARADRFADSRLVEPRSIDRLPETRTTIAEAIRSVRPEYATAHFGKWHLGDGHPGQHGFERYDERVPDRERAAAKAARHGIIPRAVDFIRETVNEGRPFFVQISHYAIHKVYRARDDTRRQWSTVGLGRVHRSRPVAAMTADLDADLGQLLGALDELGIARDTWVIYFSDNGGYTDWSSNRPLSGGKFSLKEGGIRVPLIVRGPEVDAGRVSHVSVIAWDFLPTILELLDAKAAVPADVEGGSFAPLLRDGGKGRVERPREELVWHFPHYHFLLDGSVPRSAIRLGRFKLIVDHDTNQLRLFDLEADLSEADDLSESRPQVALRLQTRLDEYLAAVDAPRAIPRSTATTKLGSTLDR